MNVHYSDGSGIKRRPVVVVSVDAVHASRADALVVPLTTHFETVRFGDARLRDWRRAGLPRPSMAKGVIDTVARSTFGRTLGVLSGRDLSAIEQSLRRVLGLEAE